MRCAFCLNGEATERIVADYFVIDGPVEYRSDIAHVDGNAVYFSRLQLSRVVFVEPISINIFERNIRVVGSDVLCREFVYPHRGAMFCIGKSDYSLNECCIAFGLRLLPRGNYPYAFFDYFDWFVVVA